MRRFRYEAGFAANFEQPQTYEEKAQFRKLYGNHQSYAMMADKYRVREIVADRVGRQYLVPLIGVYDHLTAKVFDELPDRFVMKANHGCKWQRIVWNKAELDVPATVSYFNRILRKSYGSKSGEFHYRLIQPKIIVEELLSDGNDSPADYNFFCYHQGAEFDYALTIATPRLEQVFHFDKHWNLLEGNMTADQAAKFVRPPNFEQMVCIAEAISRGFDFLRVDLYNLDGQIYFGEATCTPGAGFGQIENPLRRKMRTEMC